MKKKLLYFLILFLFGACGIEQTTLPESTGRVGELVIVLDKKYWNSPLGQSIKNLFERPQKGLPQDEPLFKVVLFSNNAFTDMIQRHRNVLMIADVDTMNENTTMTVRKDVWAEDQLVLMVAGGKEKAVGAFIEQNAGVITDYFNKTEISRLHVKLKKLENKTIGKELQERHHLSMRIPEGYKVVTDTGNFVWMRFNSEKLTGGEYHEISRNIMVYYYDYVSASDFKKEQLTATRDSVTKRFVPGPREGSYMKITEEYSPEYKEISFNGSYAVEMRGLWNLKNDFMGGPFLSYSTVDTSRNRVLTIDAFLYCPQFDKREYLRELDAILHTVSFPSR